MRQLLTHPNTTTSSLRSRCYTQQYLLSKYHFSTPRLFSTTSNLYKDEKSKQLLKSIGLNLQKGALKPKQQSKESDQDQQKQNKAGDKSRQQQEEELAKELQQKPPEGGQFLGETGTTTGSASIVERKASLTPEPNLATQPPDSGTSSSRAISEHSTSKSHTSAPPARSNNNRKQKRRPSFPLGLWHEQEEFAQLNEAYDKVSRMSFEDIKLQNVFDDGKAFGSFPSEHYLDRQALLRSIPDTLNIFKPEDMAKVEDIYSKLNQLDCDKKVQLKYYKRYLKNYDDDLNFFIQAVNGIDQKFKLLRRREVPEVSLHKYAFLSSGNLTNLPYNIHGFDKSLIGMPLINRPNNNNDNNASSPPFPREFIQDLPTDGTTTMILKKYDLDIKDPDKRVRNLDPRDMNMLMTQDQMEQTSAIIPTPEEFIQEFISGNRIAIKIDSINNYDFSAIDIPVVEEIAQEIQEMKQLVLNDLNGLKRSYYHLGMYSTNSLPVKLSPYVLFDSPAQPSTAMLTTYASFPLLPIYSRFMNTIGLRHRLKQHFFKIFFINLEEEVETLLKYKYRNDSKWEQRFLYRLTKKIEASIDEKIMPLFETNNKEFKGHDAIIYSPYLNNNSNRNFKRIYWLDPRKYNKNRLHPNRRRTITRPRKSSMLIDFKQFDYVLSKYL
ncbi:uncharacterized protein J8A68_002922 [[Candida] subhashii]|uniref:Uncharacterized protein n=1 Tax=[Candida] subhashii TaxID=561895 RepID=A0A8J5QJZ9_9ASCO|nr:uncharacterized protein J8A68_002922 [[Candida] subhashii]KAG7663538.1 hypothetical protein J8A68_002922 [[Candida] subhashii]